MVQGLNQRIIVLWCCSLWLWVKLANYCWRLEYCRAQRYYEDWAHWSLAVVIRCMGKHEKAQNEDYHK
jgi:hypothetical protein